jgi:hypothetical protein
VPSCSASRVISCAQCGSHSLIRCKLTVTQSVSLGIEPPDLRRYTDNRRAPYEVKENLLPAGCWLMDILEVDTGYFQRLIGSIGGSTLSPLPLYQSIQLPIIQR